MTKLQKFVEKLKEIFQDRLKSVFVYGSKSNLPLDSLDEDVDIMVIVESLSGEDLRKCANPVKAWRHNGFLNLRCVNPLPVFMEEKEWFNSADVYAMEYLDIKDNHQVIFGDNLICDICVDKEDLRFECEMQMKNLLMQFRAHYLSTACNNSNMKTALIPVTKTINAVFKAILRLKDIEVSKSAYENLNKIHLFFDLDKEFYEKLLCYKEKHCCISNAELVNIMDKAVFETEKLLEYINSL